MYFFNYKVRVSKHPNHRLTDYYVLRTPTIRILMGASAPLHTHCEACQKDF